MKHEKILVLDFGGQYNQLIARRVRECNVYCEVHPYNMSIEKIKEFNPKGIIFTGGPNSVYADESPLCDKELFNLNARFGRVNRIGPGKHLVRDSRNSNRPSHT